MELNKEKNKTTISVNLKRRQGTDNNRETALYLQVIYRRKVRQISLPYKLHEDEWDENRQLAIVPPGCLPERYLYLMEINQKTSEEKQRMQTVITRLPKNKEITADMIIESYKALLRGNTFIAYIEQIIKQFAAEDRNASVRHYRSLHNSFHKYLPTENILLNDIDEELIKKYSEQLDNVRNNREYDALTKEVEFQKLEIELQQKRIREAQKLKAEKEVNLEISNKQYTEKKADLEAKKAELDDIIAETHKDEEALTQKSEELSQNIEERLLTAYRKIRDNARNGLAVVTVDRDACGGCFNKIPPQRQLDIRSRKKIIVCEYCGRILIDKYICDYDGSMQKADLESAMEAQKKKGRRIKKSEE